MSKKERGPFRARLLKSDGAYAVTGLGVRFIPSTVDEAYEVSRLMNTAYLAGKRSRSKGRGK